MYEGKKERFHYQVARIESGFLGQPHAADDDKVVTPLRLEACGCVDPNRKNSLKMVEYGRIIEYFVYFGVQVVLKMRTPFLSCLPVQCLSLSKSR